MMRKKLRIEGARMVARVAGLPKNTERKAAAAELQVIRMEKAQQQLRNTGTIQITLARRMVARAIKELEEIGKARQRQGISEKDVLEQLLPAFRHLGHKKKDMQLARRTLSEFSQTMDFIGTINAMYYKEVIGSIPDSKLNKLSKIRTFALKVSRRMTKK